MESDWTGPVPYRFMKPGEKLMGVRLGERCHVVDGIEMWASPDSMVFVTGEVERITLWPPAP